MMIKDCGPIFHSLAKYDLTYAIDTHCITLSCKVTWRQLTRLKKKTKTLQTL